MSTAPAGGNGQMRRSGLDGKFCAAAGRANSTAATRANTRDTDLAFEGRVTRNYALGEGGEYRGPAPAGETPAAARDLRLLRRRCGGRGHAAGEPRRLRAGPPLAARPGRRFENPDGSGSAW